MTPQQQGRFCGNCQKTVVDFTKMTDQQMLKYFSEMHGGNMCGRFAVEQLDRDIVLQSKKNLPWFRYFLNIMIPAMVASKSYSQGEIKTKPNVACSPSVKGDTIRSIRLGYVSSVNIQETKGVVAGTVTDNAGKPVPGATVKIKGTQIGTFTNPDGRFWFLINRSSKNTLEIAGIGFQHAEIDLKKESNVQDMKVILYGQLLGEDVVVGYYQSKPKPNVFHQFKKVITDSLRASAVRIFPNPIRSGSSINIEYKSKRPGNYEIMIVDMNGKIVQSNKFTIKTFLLQENISLNQAIMPGSYLMVLMDDKGSKVWKKKIIVQ